MATSKSLTEFCRENNFPCVQKGFILGIDIGTTSIKAALVERSSKRSLARRNVEHSAQIEMKNAGNSTRREQMVGKILAALNNCLKLIPRELLKNVKEVVVCGQMHGVVLWNREKFAVLKGTSIEEKLEQTEGLVSTLITWEDGRCSPEFLNTLPAVNPKSILASGFGCATLFWLQRNEPDILRLYDRAGTIMDLVVACLCTSDRVYMSTQNACSWGYYDVEDGDWELEKLKSEDFPTHLLPEVCDPSQIIGELSQGWCQIPPGAVVRVALGDMQCSILATLADTTDAVLNIGTSAQCSVIVQEGRKDLITRETSSNPALHILPYFNNNCLVVAAALTGGNTLVFFVNLLQSWISDLGLQKPSKDDIYRKLSECGHRDSNHPKLVIDPAIWGERHNPSQSASVTGISSHSPSLGNVYNSLCHSIIMNIHSMMGHGFLELCRVNRIMGTGNALVKNPTLQKSVQDVFDLPFALSQEADASVGAALSTVV